ncbi:unnamed protein product [marine sediment metagenome]|uniref:3-methyl-2-oxobutanoate hydroxymethyltransferase n=1 Tax=marine sediment metagenome TaxID=412755 RepID=X1PMY1_9ZZZZ
MAKKKTIFDFLEMKQRGEKITWLTAYDFPTANLAEQAGIEMLLVGDSVGMVVYGYSGTIPVTMDQMIYHTEAVRRGAPNTFIIGDMPFLSYQKSIEDAITNAGRFYKEASVDAIKLEGGKRVTPQIRGIVDSGMVAIGHIGLCQYAIKYAIRIPYWHVVLRASRRQLGNTLSSLFSYFL